MPWFKVDDALAFHPKVVAAGNSAMGMWVRAGSWAAHQLTDGHVPQALVTTIGTKSEARQLVTAGLWLPTDSGYTFKGWEEYQPTKAEVQVNRASNARRQALARDTELRETIRIRDGERCRYCGQLVSWRDRRGPLGATYDHVDPHGPNSEDNLVVACRGCNASKSQRTPEAAGMRLLPPPTPRPNLTVLP